MRDFNEYITAWRSLVETANAIVTETVLYGPYYSGSELVPNGMSTNCFFWLGTNITIILHRVGRTCVRCAKLSSIYDHGTENTLSADGTRSQKNYVTSKLNRFPEKGTKYTIQRCTVAPSKVSEKNACIMNVSIALLTTGLCNVMDKRLKLIFFSDRFCTFTTLRWTFAAQKFTRWWLKPWTAWMQYDLIPFVNYLSMLSVGFVWQHLIGVFF
jgi:hypothetical protein